MNYFQIESKFFRSENWKRNILQNTKYGRNFFWKESKIHLQNVQHSAFVYNIGNNTEIYSVNKRIFKNFTNLQNFCKRVFTNDIIYKSKSKYKYYLTEGKTCKITFLLK